jgi:predicted nucleic acid-binding protein
MLAVYDVAPFDQRAAEAAAAFANTLKARGRALHHIDVMVAGIAIARDDTLVTRDKDFARAPGLKVESWT